MIEDKDQHLRGAGDVVEMITEILGIKYLVRRVYGECGCSKRKDKLNNLIPFNPKIDYIESIKKLKDE
tara:strand:+ start:698 stop:901 length:204 start_codon:yes stop_codon:yes gene_type:complete